LEEQTPQISSGLPISKGKIVRWSENLEEFKDFDPSDDEILEVTYPEEEIARALGDIDGGTRKTRRIAFLGPPPTCQKQFGN
jgi:hypothetical protein